MALASEVGETSLRARISDRMPQGVVYTTFHHPISGANVVTTEHSDWATNCPEYEVTAVQVYARSRVAERSDLPPAEDGVPVEAAASTGASAASAAAPH